MDEHLYDFRKELQNLGYSKEVINNYPKYAQNLLNYSKENPQEINDIHIKNYYQYLFPIMSNCYYIFKVFLNFYFHLSIIIYCY